MSVKLQYLNIFTDHRDMGLLIGEKSKGDETIMLPGQRIASVRSDRK